MTAHNPLPTFEPIADNYVSLPLHVMDTATRLCIYCDKEPYRTYEEYLVDYAESYEGVWLSGPYSPDEPEWHNYFASTCHGAWYK